MKDKTTNLWQVNVYYNGNLYASQKFNSRSEANLIARNIRTINGWSARVIQIVATIKD